MVELQRAAHCNELPFRLAAQPVATGRLGKIYPALDELSGRIILVERVPLRPSSGRSTDAFDLLEQVLLPELAAGDANRIGSHKNVVWYNAMHCVTTPDDPHVLLSAGTQRDGRAHSAPARLVSRYIASAHSPLLLSVLTTDEAMRCFVVHSLLQDFGKLYPLVVQRYAHDIVNGLRALHAVRRTRSLSFDIATLTLTHLVCSFNLAQAGVVLGGIASSSVLISSDGTARLVGCFPSPQALRVLLDSDVLASDEIPRCVLNRQIEPPALAQDIRSVAYVIAEMLTGTRMRGHLLQRDHLERHVASCSSSSAAHQRMLEQLLHASSLNELLPPLDVGESETHSTRALQSGASSPFSLSERRAIARLMEHELTACREQRRHALHDIRTWVTQFEKRHSRRPSASDRPTSITRLQRRCRALADRITALETRLNAARTSFYHKPQDDADNHDDREQQQLDDVSGRDTTPVPLVNQERDDSSSSSAFGSLLAIDVSVRNSSDRSDVQRRSPAQHAFLQRLSPPIETTTSDTEVRSLCDADDHITSDRTAGHRIIHQRKDVMAVIHTIAASTSSTSPTVSPHLL